MRRIKGRINRKALILLVSSVLAIWGSIGSSMAWLVDTVPAASNTFTVGEIQASQTTQQTAYALRGDTALKMVPGCDIKIDSPEISVSDESEDCYLFVKISEDIGSLPTASFKSYLDYSVTDGWIAGDGEEGNGVPEGVYFRVVLKDEQSKEFSVIKDSKVSVSEDMTEEMMTMLYADGASLPSLQINAYAVQLYASGEPFTPAQAWDAVSES